MSLPESEGFDSLSTCRDDELSARSRDDARFDAILRHGTYVDAEGNITMPLPFRFPEQLMPDNKRAVYARTKNSLIRTARDPDQLSKCTDTMGQYWACNHVEQIPDSEPQPPKGRGFWITVFAVPKKGGKVQLVFDSHASFQEVS